MGAIGGIITVDTSTATRCRQNRKKEYEQLHYNQ